MNSLDQAITTPNAPTRVRSQADPQLSLPFRIKKRLSTGTPADSIIINSENHFALTRLLDSTGLRFRCIYLDPPYNNRETYRHYNDKREHNEWLSDLVARLSTMRSLLLPTGSIWISIDDGNMHYLKVAADEVLGRENFVSTIVWQQRTTRENRRAFSNNHEYLLVYAANHKSFSRSRNLLPPTETLISRYKNPDNDPRGPWQSVSANVQAGHATASQFYEVVAPNGTRHSPPKGRCWVYSFERMSAEIAAGNIWFGKDGWGVPRIKRFLHEAKVGLTPETLWTADITGTNDDAKKHLLKMFPTHPLFDTPKPEQLIARILEIATDRGDFVLDPYLGSGTTGAVAHKMHRRFVGIEEVVQAAELSASRLRRVVGGEAGGISPQVNWAGGGDVAYYGV